MATELLVLKITGPAIHPNVGEYVRDFDRVGNDGRGTVFTTETIALAKLFASTDEADSFVNQPAANGKPSLTYFSLELVPVQVGS